MVKTKIINLSQPKDYFCFSKAQNKAADLDYWFDWFQARGIPCCIVKQKRGTYVLWREGEEADIPYWEDRLHGKRLKEYITPEMKIVKSYKWKEIDANME